MTDYKGKTVFVTKYVGAISECVVQKQYDYEDYTTLTMIGNTWTSFTLGRDVFLSKEEAVADANKRLAKKVASLQKQIAKLEKATFE